MFNKPVYTDNNHFLGIGGYLDKDRALTGLITCSSQKTRACEPLHSQNERDIIKKVHVLPIGETWNEEKTA